MRNSVSAVTVILAMVCGFEAQAQTTLISTHLSNDEAVAFIKGQNLNSVRLAGGNPYLQFKEDGTMYSSNSGSNDSGKWKMESGRWQTVHDLAQMGIRRLRQACTGRGFCATSLS